ncbi:leucyl aminopeptidase family protein [Caulobacter vibrioides]|uniref:Cytosol aminopeptidase family protein n=2 Tax=Caulobacter vibrioides TaxID=155892 RepID=Q9A4A0_CAUVC|nr:M17 family metallopeptidase [Caulobacter vibrioides]YP_002518405.1 leucyl aminopeptidase [Caulobacter vibrioides NA1000]AAK24899.1 cytosol aminopeptidase family protein [Caulobacter vibrioides CB15]ACL96497.1 leucyl aminopeptidase [Caulobacter vibrioides NA1000]ATC29770.1 leucyl aminopeptidase [Caulobacter vibrioides]QXZ51288.1 leucyl aminopeptidase [Caulobacter vibrioides]
MTDAAHPILAKADGQAIPVHPVAESEVEAFLARKRAPVRTYAAANKFTGKTGQVLAVPGASGAVEQVLMGVGSGRADLSLLRGLAGKLPAGDYALSRLPKSLDGEQAALAFALGTYRYDRYKKRGEPIPRLVAPKGVDVAFVTALAHACALCRDMVNTPANDMGPLQIETIAGEIAEQYGATLSVVRGDDLLKENYPAVHAVGRAAVDARAPRMIEIAWGDPAHPVLALVGKGVVFDTGGLDIKPSSGMRLMKKDMGGAAHVLALGRMVMEAKLPVRLVILTPVVENAIAGDAMRPGDVLQTRAGLTVEVGNTDAEGRLILADALTRAAELKPALTLDFATLTGAARVAMGPFVIPFWTADDTLAGQIETASRKVSDPLWRLPLTEAYRDALDSDIADLKNDPDGWAQAGATTAALFLQRFAPTEGGWAHFDVFAWNPKGRPGYPVGAEVQAIRAAFAMLQARFAR